MYEWLSVDDYLVWTQVIRAVVPISKRRHLSWEAQRGQIKGQTSGKVSLSSHNAQKVWRYQGGHHWPHHSDDHPMDRRTISRFRHGHLSIESRLDLHGLGQTRAYVALRRFVDMAWRSGLRSVLVITGKGTRANGKIGVLRTAVPLWLNEPDLRPKVLSFTYAQPRDGGEGALYLLIRRRCIDIHPNER